MAKLGYVAFFFFWHFFILFCLNICWSLLQLVDKDPSKAISLFWSAINTGDRVDSALKDMAIVMKQLDRAEEAVEAIKSFRHLCSYQSQEALDNVLLDLYKVNPIFLTSKLSYNLSAQHTLFLLALSDIGKCSTVCIIKKD